MAADSNGDLGNEARVDVALHGLFKRGQTTILDICVMGTPHRCQLVQADRVGQGYSILLQDGDEKR